MPQKKPDGRAGKAGEADGSTLARDPQKYLSGLTSLGKFTGIVDRKGRLQFASEAPLKALGYAEEDILRKPFWEAEWFRPLPGIPEDSQGQHIWRLGWEERRVSCADLCQGCHLDSCDIQHQPPQGSGGGHHQHCG